MFDKYIIKEHWTEPADLVLGTTPGIEYLGRSPFDQDIVNALGDSYIFHHTHCFHL